ncbi:hypothetical protein [Nocardia salmonicida]
MGIALAADRAGNWLRRSSIRQQMERALAAVLIRLGIGIAAEAR